METEEKALPNHASAFSCRRYGCEDKVVPSQPCQCDPYCSTYSNCCHDFLNECQTVAADLGAGPEEANQALPTCRRYGCAARFEPAQPCQCNAKCASHGNCCSDYTSACSAIHSAESTPSPAPKAESTPSQAPRTFGKTPERLKEHKLVRGSTEEIEERLQKIDEFLDQQPRQDFLADGAGLLQTFGPHNKGGGPCGDDCELPEPCPEHQITGRCRFDAYDSAVAAIYYTKRGKLLKAWRILQGFLHLLYPSQKVPGLSFSGKDGLLSGQWLTMIAASYSQTKVDAGTYSGKAVLDGGVDTGNNAWVAMAFAHFAAASGDTCSHMVAHDILQALKKVDSCGDKFEGFMARMRPYPGKYRSTEHNTDVFALSRMLNDTATQIRASTFVQNMFGFDTRFEEFYAMGTDGAEPCDSKPRATAIAADAQFWNLLAEVDPQEERKIASLNSALQPEKKGGMVALDQDKIANSNTSTAGRKLRGLRFTNWGHGIQWENTASGVMAMKLFRHRFGPYLLKDVNLSNEIYEMQSSLTHLLDEYGSVPASVLGGNLKAWHKNNHSAEYPGGSDTGIGWTYLRYPHTAATAWTGLMLLFQAGSEHAVNEDANPFAPPKQQLPPLRKDTTCLPH
eukprot:TRINITY_DN27214_c0_g1_i1.p1 TRINITY_DN27214_c0_g1~~TRINITY_DN27214_c0_g1_i1.p1  ORF type:complete len:714 (-),score=112.68 TRINITY_DN27214_c0_g1_i1:635-2503(-)